MEYIKKTAENITKHALKVIDQIDEKQVDKMIDSILNAESTFIVGSGRSELMGKAFAMKITPLLINLNIRNKIKSAGIRITGL
ncbi:MAG: hypothetical protein K8E24_002755 [Methanobacterium paludis]|nr:hypothetical protein [Methanobacterium paludis]